MSVFIQSRFIYLGDFDQPRGDSMYVIYVNIILYKCLVIIRVFLVHFMPLYPIILNSFKIIYCTNLSWYDELNNIKIEKLIPASLQHRAVMLA